MVGPPSKVVVGIALLAVTAAGATGLLALRASLEEVPPTGAGDARVSIQLPDGSFLFNRTVPVANATALSALAAAAREGSFTYDAQSYDMGTYVVGIGGHAARGAEGWQYWVHRDGAWVQGDRSADRFPVAPGEWVHWRWSSVGETTPFGPGGGP